LIISSSVFFWLFSLAFDEWRMLILDYRVTYVCSRLVERRLWWDVIKLDEKSHQTHCERLIKLDESDSSRLTTSSHQTWLKRFIKLDDVISSNLTKAIHQTWQMISHQTRRRLCLSSQISVLEWQEKVCRVKLSLLRENVDRRAWDENWFCDERSKMKAETMT
jgi:hypothetical protein